MRRARSGQPWYRGVRAQVVALLPELNGSACADALGAADDERAARLVLEVLDSSAGETAVAEALDVALRGMAAHAGTRRMQERLGTALMHAPQLSNVSCHYVWARRAASVLRWFIKHVWTAERVAPDAVHPLMHAAVPLAFFIDDDIRHIGLVCIAKAAPVRRTRSAYSHQSSVKALVPWCAELLPSDVSKRSLFDLRHGPSAGDACDAMAALFAAGSPTLRDRPSGFWSMARRSVRPGTFTSHSERLGSWVCGTRAALAEALSEDDAQAAPLLRLARQFCIGTRGSPLAAEHAAVLHAPVARWCGVADLDVALAAYSVVALWPRDQSTLGHVLWLAECTDTISDTLCEPVWATAAALVQGDAAVAAASVSAAAPRMTRDLMSSSAPRRCGATHILAQWLAEGASDAERRPWVALADAAPALMVYMATSNLRGRLCALWPDYVLCAALHDDVRLHGCTALLWPLCRDADAGVRAEAVRALGVLMERVRGTSAAPWLTHAMDKAPLQDVLWGRAALLYDGDEQVRWQAAWALANWCGAEAEVGAASGVDERIDAVLCALDADAHVAVHAVRALGQLLAAADDARFTRGIRVACALLASRVPKVRWNAAVCVAHVACDPRGADACAEALGAALDDPTFKVRRIAAQALCRVVASAPLAASTRASLAARATAAAAQLTEQLHAAPFDAQQHGHACRELLDELGSTLGTST